MRKIRLRGVRRAVADVQPLDRRRRWGLDLSYCCNAQSEAVMSELPFAYSLSHEERGWTWRVFDEDGETVATGAQFSQSDAQAAVEDTIRRAAERRI